MNWDGSADGLERQVTTALRSREQMRGDAYAETVALDSVLARLRALPDYVALFQVAFPREAGEVSQGLRTSIVES